jgi:hypothetical protein
MATSAELSVSQARAWPQLCDARACAADAPRVATQMEADIKLCEEFLARDRVRARMATGATARSRAFAHTCGL